MAATRFATANKILNDVAVESGLLPNVDPFLATDPQWVQLNYLLNSAGEEMLQLHEWDILRASHTIVVDNGTYPDGHYPLPDDYSYMIDQTGWDRDNFLPLRGPTTPQQWTYLEGRNLASSTIYATFRLTDGQIWFYPAAAMEDGRTITFEYIRRTWAESGSPPTTQFNDLITSGNDRILYEPILFKRFLKMKFLGAKGFDTTAAATEFKSGMDAWTGLQGGAPVLRTAQSQRYPFLNSWRNLPDTGYGS